jgi:hypothetical protein
VSLEFMGFAIFNFYFRRPAGSGPEKGGMT